MFDIKDVKSFMDNVHGYIRIPRLFAENIIDTCEFQRLRNIDQTGMKILYPAAKHDRFSHSLGVYHLGNIAVDALLENFKENSHWKIRSNNTRYVYWAKNKVLFLIACLLHDIGHAPFSHSFETFYDFEINEYSPDEIETGEYDSGKLIDRLTRLMSLDPLSAETENEIMAINRAAQHERMSAYLLLRHGSPWRERIKKILDGLKIMPFPEPLESNIGEYDKPFPTVDSTELEDDLQFIARMIMGVKYSEYVPEKQIRNCFIELINGSVDVDKLDYIVRDTRMSGISNVTLDIERLLGSLTIVLTTVYKDYTFKNQMPEYEDVIIRKLDTYKDKDISIYGMLDKPMTIINGKVSVPLNTTISLKRNPSNAQHYLKYNAVAFSKESTVLINSLNKPHNELNDQIELERSKGNINLKLQNAEIVNTLSPGFVFTVSSDSDHSNQGAYQFWIHKPADKPVKLNAEVALNNSRFTGKIKGKVKYLEVLSDELSKNQIPPTQNCYTGYSLGFNKQAVNLISNVFDARNYLYLWIYSHHKVIYYANYLIIELARLAAPVMHTGESLYTFLTRAIIDTEESYLLDEGYIHNLIRYAYKNNSDIPEYPKLFHELVSRNYRKSVYKSLAEFDIIFERFDLSQKMKIRKHLEKISLSPINGVSPTSVQTLKYGYINPDEFKLMKYDDIDLSDILEDMIWIESKPSIKRPDPSQIMIAFKREDMIVSMDRLPILNAESRAIEQKHYFYLYFREKPESAVSDIRTVIKKAFLNYLDNIIDK